MSNQKVSISRFSDFSESDVNCVHALIRYMEENNINLQNPDDYAVIQELANDLPSSLRDFLDRTMAERQAVTVVDTTQLVGPVTVETPAHWNIVDELNVAKRQSYVYALISSYVGYVFGWATQQNGRLMHDILPIKEHSYEQVGFSSSEELSFHTEDAFHENRCDFLSLMCMRNNEKVPTSFWSAHGLGDEVEQFDKLFEEHFAIMPDNSHKPELNQGSVNSFDSINQLLEKPRKTSVLSGEWNKPDLCIDPDYCLVTSDSEVAQQQYSTFVQKIKDELIDISLTAGEICLVNNSHVVHGRRRFTASFNGQDRWLKRLNLFSHKNKEKIASINSKTRLIG
ncbi:hypothetical protein F0251_13390 [Vibrio sp. 070316B]|uniref:hypothetical protein n=1 Tax=Vibrio sp. 070316B TaxID=2607608 RepID=UPI0014933373|nr:hypothetical protein [Vibrio sp. 070316B]NOI39431.1 hypothetical protein [Vibrio sp. 070316B]